jgi:hypothetical protein
MIDDDFGLSPDVAKGLGDAAQDYHEERRRRGNGAAARRVTRSRWLSGDDLDGGFHNNYGDPPPRGEKFDRRREPPEPPPPEQEEPQRKITPTPFVWRDPRTIPRRRWLYGKHYIRQFVSVTVAPGGIGKTSLSLVEALSMATGRALLGVPVPERLRVWYWNGEDPKDEIDRRVAAIMLHFKIAPEEIEGWFFADSGRETSICIAGRMKDGVVFTPDAEAIKAGIIERKIDVFVVDPFVKTHGVPENDNGVIDRVARRFADIADETKCAVELLHHVRKPSNLGRAETTVDDGRGAGSLVNAARSARVLNVMTDQEAISANVSEGRRRYFRVDDGKENMSPPAEGANWFKLVSVPLDNDEDGGALGDWVGVATAWTMPGVFDGRALADLPKVQAAIDRGSWAKDSQAVDWAGKAVAAVLDINLADPAGKEHAKRLLAAWLKSGALKEGTRAHPQKRNSREQATIVVGNRVEGWPSEGAT